MFGKSALLRASSLDLLVPDAVHRPIAVSIRLPAWWLARCQVRPRLMHDQVQYRFLCVGLVLQSGRVGHDRISSRVRHIAAELNEPAVIVLDATDRAFQRVLSVPCLLQLFRGAV
jgi:hypothetical protein